MRSAHSGRVAETVQQTDLEEREGGALPAEFVIQF